MIIKEKEKKVTMNWKNLDFIWKHEKNLPCFFIFLKNKCYM